MLYWPDMLMWRQELKKKKEEEESCLKLNIVKPDIEGEKHT